MILELFLLFQQLNQNPSKLIITSHFGRPIDKESKYSLLNILYCLEKHIDSKIEFLPYGISSVTLEQIINSKSKIFLLENLRFHKEETEYEKGQINLESNNIISIYNMLGDVFISDAFGCTHRSHMSISGIKEFEIKQNKTIGYGHLINKEITYLSDLICVDKKILCIIGGNKIADKLPLIDSFKHLPNATIFVGGGLAKHYLPDTLNTIIMEDGWGNKSLDLPPYYIPNIKETELNTYDIGPKSKSKLFDLILKSDIVFWNGSLGVIENDFYKCSSLELVNYLESNKQIKTIIGGGETSSLISNKNSSIYISTGGGALLEYLQQKFKDGTNISGIKIYE
jgi:phosphoglycerate kinase